MKPSGGSPSEQGFTLIELIVVLVILGVVGAAITATTVNAFRARTFQQEMADAQFEARLVFERVRREVRAARRVEAISPDMVTFWVDENFDGLQQADEVITYEVDLVGGETDRYQVLRYTGAIPKADASVLASVLRNSGPFAWDLTPPSTRAITMDFDYDVTTTRGPSLLEVSTTIRLRNVA